MEYLSFADHFSSPWAVAVAVAFLAMQVCSMIVFAINVLEYRKVVWKHRILPQAIEHSLEAVPEKGTISLLIAYVVLTAVVTVGTALLFLFQPHLY